MHTRIDYIQFIYEKSNESEIFETFSFPIAAYDRNGIIAGANEIFREIVDISEGDIQSGNINIFDCIDKNNTILSEAAHNAFDGSEKVFRDIGCALKTKTRTGDFLLPRFPNAIFFPMTFERDGVKLGAVLLDDNKNRDMDEAEEVSEPIKKNKPHRRFFTYAAACAAIVIIGIGAIALNNNRSGGIIIENDPVPLAAPMFLQADESSKPYTGGGHGIILPGIDSIVIPADTADVQILLYNPADNDFDLAFEITVDDEIIYSSGLVEPGMCVEDITLAKGLAYGEYKAILEIRAYAPGDFTQTGSASVEFDLLAEQGGA